MTKNNTSASALLMFHETRRIKHNKYFRVLSCVIHTIIYNYVCIDYLACQSKTLSQISIDSKYGEKYFNIILSIRNPDLLMNLL